MYKCTECGSEFELKPEYCDCGNNEFVLTIDKTETPEQILKDNNEQNIEKEIKISEIHDNNGNNYFQPDIKTSKKAPFREMFSINPVALAVFLTCIIFSLLIIFVWNPVNTNIDSAQNTNQTIVDKAIPSIDKLWKESSHSVKTATIEKQKGFQQIKTQSPVTLEKIVVKPTQTNKQPIKTNKTVVKQKTNNTVKTDVKIPKVDVATQKAQADAKKTQEDLKKAQEAKQKAEAEALAAAENARKAALAKQELSNYKINLRNEIGKKIDFTKVIGDGDCVISFKLDSNGKLVNRAFAKQSTNITLNNAVYNAVMATPFYKSPPSLYNNETFKLFIKFANGNFAITLD